MRPHGLRSTPTTLLSQGLLALLVLGWPARTVGQVSVIPYVVKIQPGLPDLVVHATATPTLIPGGRGLGNIPQGSAVVTITVENRFTSPSWRRTADGSVWVFGAEAKDFDVVIEIPYPLSQVGGVIAPDGSQVYLALCGNVGLPSHRPLGVDGGRVISAPCGQTLACHVRAIPAGGSVDLVFEVVSEAVNGRVTVVVRTNADPSGAVREMSESNNEATLGIVVVSP